MRFHFIGTSYAPPPLGRESVMPVARAEGVEAHVAEHCARVPYFDALHYIVKSDALVVVGSDDPTYSASKIFPCMLARRPALLVFHRNSPVLAFAEKAGYGERFGFSSPADIDMLSVEIHRRWFAGGGLNAVPGDMPAEFHDHTAETMTRRLATCFDMAVPPSSP